MSPDEVHASKFALVESPKVTSNPADTIVPNPVNRHCSAVRHASTRGHRHRRSDPLQPCPDPTRSHQSVKVMPSAVAQTHRCVVEVIARVRQSDCVRSRGHARRRVRVKRSTLRNRSARHQCQRSVTLKPPLPLRSLR